MASRPIVSYDDITPPYDASRLKSQPPSKKRKRHHKKAQPAEGRELTHDEIWDDSALIDAWDAAMEEYEAFHGPDKGWKKEPVHKSPLKVHVNRWYNVPPETTSQLKAVDNGDEMNSQPINFDTFVPTHDPSLSAATQDAQEEDNAHARLPYISQDEAFERAIQASYWSGYWTAVYHTLSQSKTSTEAEAEEIDEDIDEDEGEDESGDSEEFVSTQR